MYSKFPASVAHTCHTPLARNTVTILAAVFAMTSLAGCALLSSDLEKAAKSAGKVVKSYCENVTVPEVRQQIQDAINAKAAPHSVAVTCADTSTPPAP